MKSLYEGDEYVFKHNVSDDTSVGLKYDEYEVRYQWLKPFFEKSSRVLEIGCGDGKFLKKIKNDVAAADGKLGQDELLMLREIRHELSIDRLHGAAIEQAARARFRDLA